MLIYSIIGLKIEALYESQTSHGNPAGEKTLNPFAFLRWQKSVVDRYVRHRNTFKNVQQSIRNYRDCRELLDFVLQWRHKAIFAVDQRVQVVGRTQHIEMISSFADWKFKNPPGHLSVLEIHCEGVGIHFATDHLQRRSVQLKENRDYY